MSGAGRFYCDLHWLTDVVSGIALGHVCVIGAQVLGRRVDGALTNQRST